MELTLAAHVSEKSKKSYKTKNSLKNIVKFKKSHTTRVF
jgi:hypothetical protein